MDNYDYVLSTLEKFGDNNHKMFSGLKDVLYFKEEVCENQPDYLNDNSYLELYKVDISEEKEEKTDRDLNMNVKAHFNIDQFDMSKKYLSFTDCVLSSFVDNYKTRESFFKKLTREIDIYRLFTKFNSKKYANKNMLKNALNEGDDDKDYVRQFIVDYLNINLFIIKTDEIQSIFKDRQYELYRATIFIYENEGLYSFFSTDNRVLFTSNDDCCLKMSKYMWNKQIVSFEPKDKKIVTIDKFLEPVKKVVVKVNYSTMKVAELIQVCLNMKLEVQKPTKNGKGKKNKTKKELLAML